MTDIKLKAVSGLIWVGFEKFGQQGVQFIVSVILARILIPEQFGLVGMVSIFIVVAKTFVNSGYSQALIQKKNASRLDECSIFYFNIAVGVIGTLITYLLAPYIAAFYGEPQLIKLVRVMSLVLLINSASLVQMALLTKAMKYKKLSTASILATILSAALGIIMALGGAGVWSIVLQQLSFNLFRTLILWKLSSWRPDYEFSIESLKSMFGFGSKLLASGLLDAIFRNIYSLVIGKWFSANELGLYTRGKGLIDRPIMALSELIGKVTYPLFCELQNEEERLRQVISKVVKILALIVIPLVAYVFAAAESIVIGLLTEKWKESIPFLRMLSIVALLHPFQVVNIRTLLAKGETGVIFKIEIAKKAVIAIVLVVTYKYGIMAIVAGGILSALCAYAMNTFSVGKTVGYGLGKQIRDMNKGLIIGITIIGVVFACELVLNTPYIIKAFIEFVIALGVYVAMIRLIAMNEYRYYKNIAKHYSKERQVLRNNNA